jgi:branched-chain amino acid transport system substrate-binding protein
MVKRRWGLLLIGVVIVALLAALTYYMWLPRPAAGTLKIGYAIPYTHALAVDTKLMIEDIADTINREGGILGKKIELYFEDTREFPTPVLDETIMAVEKLITTHGCKIIIGGCRTETSEAMAEYIATRHPGVLFIAHGGIAQKLITLCKQDYNKYKYVTLRFQVQLDGFVLPYIKELELAKQANPKISTVFFIGEDAAWSRMLAKTLVENVLPKLGYTLVGERYYPVGTTDFSMILLAAKQSGAHVVVFFHHAPAPALFKQAKEIGLSETALLTGINTQASHFDFWEMTGGGAKYALLATLYVDYIEGKPVAKIIEDFIKKHGHYPYTLIATPDELYIIKRAMEIAGTTEDTDKILEAIESMKYEGARGFVYEWRKEDHSLVTDDALHFPSPIFQWVDPQHYNIIWPKHIANATRIELPPGLITRL